MVDTCKSTCLRLHLLQSNSSLFKPHQTDQIFFPSCKQKRKTQENSSVHVKRQAGKMEGTIRKTRSGKLLGTVVTKKVVKETVEVTFAPQDSSSQENNQNVEVNVISSTTKENEKVEVFTSSGKKTPVRSVYVDFGEKVKDHGNKEEEEERRKEELKQKDERAQEAEEQQQREHIQELEKQQMREFEEGVRNQQLPPESAPRQLEEKAGDEEDREVQAAEDDDETQPASQPEVTPTPPPLEKEIPSQEEEEWFEVEGEPEERQQQPDNQNEKKREMQPGLSTPPRYEAPPAKGEETETKKRKSTTKAPKGAGEDSGGRKKRRKSKQVDGVVVADYRTYIYRVLKQVHPDHGISSKAMITVNSFLNDMYEKIAEEAARLLRHSDGKTLSARDVQDAVKLVLPGELGRHAIAEGAKAVTCYATSTSKG